MIFERYDLFLPSFVPACCPEFEPLLSWRFWLIPQEWSSTDPSLVYPSTMTTECYDEQLSDKCLTLLLGTWCEHKQRWNECKTLKTFFFYMESNTGKIYHDTDFKHIS